MLTKTGFALAVILATASHSLAATKPHASAPVATAHNVYNPYGANIGTDPDPSIRFNLIRDWSHGRY
jgi:hypothetical protein